MRAGCLAANSITPRAGSAKERPMQNFRPAFESIILLGKNDDAPSRLNEALGQLLGNAREKGAGAQVERILRTYALEIKNDIVLLTLRRLDDLVRSTPADRLDGRLAQCEALMREFHDAADTVPAVMVNVAKMPGCKELSLKSMRAVISAGLSKSSSLCPKEVTASIQREYESGALDSVREIAQARDAAWVPEAAFAPSPTIAQASAPAANPGQAQPSAGGAEAPAELVHEAVPIIHYLSVKNVEEGTAEVRSFSQAVPEMVASHQRERIRRGKEESEAKPARPVGIQAQTAARDAVQTAPRQGQAGAGPAERPAPIRRRAAQNPKAIAKRMPEAPPVRSERKDKAAAPPSRIPLPETRPAPEMPRAPGKAVDGLGEKKPGTRRGTGKRVRKPAPAQKPPERNRKKAPEKRAPRKPKGMKMRDRAAAAKPKSEGLMKKSGRRPRKAGKKKAGGMAPNPVSRRKGRPKAKAGREAPKKTRKKEKAQKAAEGPGARPKQKTARAASWSCSLILKKPGRARAARKESARSMAVAALPRAMRARAANESRRKAPRSVTGAVRGRKGEILFKLGL